MLNARAKRANDDLKSRILSVMSEHQLTQEMLADAVGCNQSTISRWLAYGADQFIPGILSVLLDRPELKPLAVDIIRFQAESAGMRIGPMHHDKEALNGSVVDEMLELTDGIGKLAEVIHRDPHRVNEMRPKVIRLYELLDRFRGELTLLEGRKS